MKIKLVLAAVIVIAVAVWAASTFTGSLTSYVSFTEAQQRGTRVQVMGAIDHDQVVYNAEAQVLTFPITDEEGLTMQVEYSGIMPGNFDQASHVVAIGAYGDEKFAADQLLVKCPSKYLGETEMKEGEA
ncbi:MAG: cytochrome c maturation protein CcmE [bacterium]